MSIASKHFGLTKKFLIRRAVEFVLISLVLGPFIGSAYLILVVVLVSTSEKHSAVLVLAHFLFGPWIGTVFLIVSLSALSSDRLNNWPVLGLFNPELILISQLCGAMPALISAICAIAVAQKQSKPSLRLLAAALCGFCVSIVMPGIAIVGFSAFVLVIGLAGAVSAVVCLSLVLLLERGFQSIQAGR